MNDIKELAKKNKLAFIVISLIICVAMTYLFYKQQYAWIRIFRYIFMTYSLIILSYIDIKKRIVPNRILLYMLLVRLIFLASEVFMYSDVAKTSIYSAMLGLFIGAVIFFISYILSRGAIGMGDVKLMGIIGFYVGIKYIISCMLLSLILAAVIGILLIAFKKISMKDHIPFVPFLTIGTVICIIFEL